MPFWGNLFTVIVTGASMHYDDILCKKLQIFATKTSLSLAKSPQGCSSWSHEPICSHQLFKGSSEALESIRPLETLQPGSFLQP